MTKEKTPGDSTRKEIGSITLIEVAMLSSLAVIVFVYYISISAKAENVVKNENCVINYLAGDKILTPVSDACPTATVPIPTVTSTPLPTNTNTAQPTATNTKVPTKTKTPFSMSLG